ncbi:MAG: hypothetical protein IPJ34_05605 [Myxococcales bacterium]|nr:hypothetical protein [Myxococcales bacterium]
MNYRNLTAQIQRHLISNNTTPLQEWFTDWMSCDGIDNIRLVIKVKNSGASFSWQPIVQYAAVRVDSPGAATTIGNGQSNNGEYNPGDIAVATDMGNNRLFRLGVQYSSASASVQQGDVYLQASWRQAGTDLGTRRVTLAVADSSDKYEVLTPWMPATFMAKVKAAFVLTSITPSNGNLRYMLAYQTADTAIEQPGTWQDAEAGWSQPGNGTTYAERNTGERSLANLTQMWFRLGVKYSQAGGVDANYTAVLDAALACR